MEEDIVIRLKKTDWSQLKWFINKIAIEYKIEKPIKQPISPLQEETLKPAINPEAIDERYAHLNQIIKKSCPEQVGEFKIYTQEEAEQKIGETETTETDNTSLLKVIDQINSVRK